MFLGTIEVLRVLLNERVVDMLFGCRVTCPEIYMSHLGVFIPCLKHTETDGDKKSGSLFRVDGVWFCFSGGTVCTRSQRQPNQLYEVYRANEIVKFLSHVLNVEEIKVIVG